MGIILSLLGLALVVSIVIIVLYATGVIKKKCDNFASFDSDYTGGFTGNVHLKSRIWTELLQPLWYSLANQDDVAKATKLQKSLFKDPKCFKILVASGKGLDIDTHLKIHRENYEDEYHRIVDDVIQIINIPNDADPRLRMRYKGKHEWWSKYKKHQPYPFACPTDSIEDVPKVWGDGYTKQFVYQDYIIEEDEKGKLRWVSYRSTKFENQIAEGGGPEKVIRKGSEYRGTLPNCPVDFFADVNVDYSDGYDGNMEYQGRIWTEICQPLWYSLKTADKKLQESLFLWPKCARILVPSGAQLTIKDHINAHKGYTDEKHKVLDASLDVLNLPKTDSDTLRLRYRGKHLWWAKYKDPTKTLPGFNCNGFIKAHIYQDWLIEEDTDGKLKIIEFRTPTMDNADPLGDGPNDITKNSDGTYDGGMPNCQINF